MFFIMGIDNSQKEISYNRMITCAECGAYGRYMVFMTYTVLSFFFIPCLKWNKHYFVKSSCCNTVYELDPEIGKRIARGEDIEILQDNLRKVNTNERSFFKRCRNCGYETAEDFDFCPKCGVRF